MMRAAIAALFSVFTAFMGNKNDASGTILKSEA